MLLNYLTTNIAGMRRWLKNYVSSNGNTNTASIYVRYQNDFIHFCKEAKLDASSPEAVAFFYVYCAESKKYAANTLGVVAAALAHMFRHEDRRPNEDRLTKDVLRAATAKAAPAKGKMPLELIHLNVSATYSSFPVFSRT